MIETFIISWNEIETIKLTLKHYLKFGKVNLYDNFSDDGTPEVADNMGAFVQSFGKKDELSEKEYLKVKNNAWKKSSADFVIVCDVDEILIADPKFLNSEKSKGVTIFNTTGFDIYSEKMPKNNWSEINTGFINHDFSKKVIFSPELQAINYNYGCHTCQPQGKIKFSDSTLPLFHYRNVGGVQRLINRHKEYRKRLSKFNKNLKLTGHYLINEDKKLKQWKESLEKSKEFSADII